MDTLIIAITLWIVWRMVVLLAEALSGHQRDVLRGGVTLIAVAAVISGDTGAAMVTAWWCACLVVSAVITSLEG